MSGENADGNTIPLQTITTPITQLLDGLAIPYTLLPHVKSALTCEEAARERGVDIEEMVKCLVMRDRATGRAIVACVPGNRRVSMSALKKIAGVKAFDTASAGDIHRLTGFERGSIPPLALPADIILIADESILDRAKVNISSGIPTAGVELSSADFSKTFAGTFSRITE